MRDIGDIQIVLSAIFFFIGSCTLFVSFLICGHNVFKDLSFRVSAMLSGFVGFWLFVISPVSFVIFFPELFLGDDVRCMPVTDLVYNIHRLIEDTIRSFILSAVGLGIMIGALSEIQPRRSLIQYINKTLGLSLREFSYEFAWDGFLRGIKRLGIITLIFEDKIITGQLSMYSVQVEPKQLVMQRCCVTPLKETHRKKRERVESLLVTELSQIKEITAPKFSFRKHYHGLNHCALTTYLMVSSMGCCFLVRSLQLSIRFLHDKGFDYAIYIYFVASLLFLVASAGFIVLGLKGLRHDFNSFHAAAIFYPSLLMALGVLIFALYYLTFSTIARFYFTPDWLNMLLVSIMVAIYFAVLYYSLSHNRKIHDNLRELIKTTDNPEQGYELWIVKDVMEQLYTAADLNDPAPIKADIIKVVKALELSREPLRYDLAGVVAAVIDKSNVVIQENRILRGEQANIIMKWHHILRTDLPLKKRWWWPGKKNILSPQDA